jgi:hypothetical protein
MGENNYQFYDLITLVSTSLLSAVSTQVTDK